MNTIALEAPSNGRDVADAEEPTDPKVHEQPRPTVWGLTPTELHDRFWAARGVQVVRHGESTEVVADAKLFLLTSPRLFCLFRLRELVDRMSWLRPDVLWVRLQDRQEREYQEHVVTDGDGRFLRFDRHYGGTDTRRLARVALTSDRRIAEIWRSASDTIDGWTKLRRSVLRRNRLTASVKARTFDRESDAEVARLVHELVVRWNRPNATVARARRGVDQTWRDPSAVIDDKVRFLGPTWVGAGRHLDETATVVGPAVLWDAPESRPDSEQVNWRTLEPGQIYVQPPRTHGHRGLQRPLKRLFDIAFALAALAFTLPLYPVIMVAIWLEDGRPFFFAHRRETLGGREFWCLKFRTMKTNAEQIKRELMAANEVDGPQFYIANDPRITRVGRFLRSYHLDELPQFLNVLAGDMSVVGPRPSPRSENQYCPTWREARLSVRPGITGLWQVMRTRGQDTDFQEWIRFDIEYVERGSFLMDCSLIARTVLGMFRPR